MTAFSMEVKAIGIGAQADSKRNTVKVQVTLGQAFPISMGDGQPMVAPFGIINFDLDHESAIKFAEQLKEEGEKTTQPSSLTIASNLSSVEKAADELHRITGR